MTAYCQNGHGPLAQELSRMIYRCPECGWWITELELREGNGGMRRPLRAPSRLHPLVQLDEQLRAMTKGDADDTLPNSVPGV